MATKKGNSLSLKDKQYEFADNISDEQYSNLNLNNRNLQNKFFETQKTNNSGKYQNNDFTDSYDLQSKRYSNSWNKSNKNTSSNFLNLNRESGEEHEFKHSKSANKSTLSLHIAAYENSIETDSDGVEKEASKKGIKSSGLIKKWRTSSYFVDGSISICQNSFEFSRQEEDQASAPELMQFRRSQRLLNPNQMDSNSQVMPPPNTFVAGKKMSDSPAAAPPPRDRPSMVGLPPTASIKKEAAVKSPGRRGRKPKSQARSNESESEMDLTVDDSNPATPSQNESVQEDEDGNPTPAKKRRGRPPEATSVRAKKEKEKMRREKDKERKDRKKKDPKTEGVEGDTAAEQEEESTEQDQEMEVTEGVESETEEDRPDQPTANTTDKNVMPEVYLRGYSSFQLFCDYILRKLILKDPEGYFTYPVSTHVAPDYHQIITKPMNFLTIRQKLSANEYTKLEEIKDDFLLICDNAMLYNNPHTVYYVAAQKLQALTKYYFSEDYLEYLRYTLPFGRDLERQILGLPEKDIPQRTQRVPTEPRPAFQKQQMESITAKKLLADAPAALRKKLTTEVPKWPLGYIDNHEGAVALNLVTSTEAAKIPLGDLIGKIEAGHTGLLQNFEEAFPALTPSSYLNYEPFASFAPMYDTTWATMNQRDSELLTQTYGDRENAADIFQLRQMVVDSGGYFLELFDNMLNNLTDGEHSRTIETLQTTEKDVLEAVEKNLERPTTPTSFQKLLDDIATLENIGIDTSFVEEIKAEYGLSNMSTATMIPEEEIERNGYMIQDLTYLQNQRLTRTVTNLADISQISDAEIELSSRIATNFQQQIIQFNVCPNEMVSTQTIHNAIGVNEDVDYDILREFMDF